jgi:hypothetical protein
MPTWQLIDKTNSPLHKLKWVGQEKSDYIAALMLYITIVHHANDKQSLKDGNLGDTQLSYDKLCELTCISRTKVSRGLKVLVHLNFITINSRVKPNIFTVIGLQGGKRWAKLPAKGLYNNNLSYVRPFNSFKLRSKVELNALKIYLVLIAFRDNSTGSTNIGYDRLVDYSAVQRNDIKSALSLLVANELIQVDSKSTDLNAYSSCNVYWLKHIESYKHNGTTGRRGVDDSSSL